MKMLCAAFVGMDVRKLSKMEHDIFNILREYGYINYKKGDYIIYPI